MSSAPARSRAGQTGYLINHGTWVPVRDFCHLGCRDRQSRGRVVRCVVRLIVRYVLTLILGYTARGRVLLLQLTAHVVI